MTKFCQPQTDNLKTVVFILLAVQFCLSINIQQLLNASQFEEQLPYFAYAVFTSYYGLICSYRFVQFAKLDEQTWLQLLDLIVKAFSLYISIKSPDLIEICPIWLYFFYQNINFLLIFSIKTSSFFCFSRIFMIFLFIKTSSFFC